MFKKDLTEYLTERLNGLIKLPPGWISLLIKWQEKIWNRFEKKDNLVKFCKWVDKLTRNNFQITPRVFLLIPNLLCFCRLTIIPFYLFGCVIGASKWFYFFVYIALMTLDLFDGLIARETGTTSSLGKAIDPLGDKVCHTSMALVILIFGFAPWWFFLGLLLKEICLAGISYFFKECGAIVWGKFGTVVEAVVLSLAIFVTLPSWVFVLLILFHWWIFYKYWKHGQRIVKKNL